MHKFTSHGQVSRHLWNQLSESFRQTDHFFMHSSGHLFNPQHPLIIYSFTRGWKPTFSTNPSHHNILLVPSNCIHGSVDWTRLITLIGSRLAGGMMFLPFPPVHSFITKHVFQLEVKVIWQKAPHGGPIPQLGVTPGGRNLYHWIPGVGVPISVP